MAKPEPQEKNSGAAQPIAKPQSLAFLNTRSANIGMWELYVSNPQVSTYEWTDKKSQEVKSNQVFRCLLVDRNDPANYCVGECKKKPTQGAQPLEAMAKKMEDGLGFRFSKVALAETKQEYISSPKKVVINLAASKLDPILATGGSAPKPVLAMTVAEVLGFNANQRFDITALVDRVSETPRQAGLARKVFDVFLVDDSKSDDKTLDLKVSLFAAERSFAALHAHMKQTAKSSTAITFFGLQATKNDKGYSVQNSRDFSGPRRRETEPQSCRTQRRRCTACRRNPARSSKQASRTKEATPQSRARRPLRVCWIPCPGQQASPQSTARPPCGKRIGPRSCGPLARTSAVQMVHGSGSRPS